MASTRDQDPAPILVVVLVALADALRRGRDVVLAVQVQGPAVGAAMLVGGHGRLAGSLGDERLDTIASPDALGALALRRTTTHHYGLNGQRRGGDVAVFVESFNRPARLVILGASGLTAALVRVASAAGFRVSVCDPRPDFATGERYPEAAAVVSLPLDVYLCSLVQLGPADAVCVMTGDPAQELAALVAALVTRVGYVGAFGNGGASASRDAALRRAGVGSEELTRISGSPTPRRAPGETAVAICADIVARRQVRPAPPLPSFR